MAAFITDPTNFPLRLDFNQGLISFVKLSREEISEAGFLDHRAPGSGVVVAATPIADLKTQWTEAKEANAGPSPKAVYIFHTAFCSSTLMSRCLDAPGKTLALKEPALLVDISSARRFGAPHVKSEITDILNVGTALLARPFNGEKNVVIKPSNGANDLLPAIMDADPQTKALLLFKDIRAFLISVIKRGEQGRQFVRMLLRHPWGGDARIAGIGGVEALQMTDLQAAAVAWRFQAEGFAKALASFPPERIRSLNADAFQSDPASTLNAIDRFFGLGLGSDHIEKTVNGPLLTMHSKQQGQIFNPETNLEVTRSIEDQFGSDMDAVIKWAAQLPFEQSGSLPSTLLQNK